MGDARDVGASGHHHQDLVMAWQLDLLARQGWGRMRLVFGCVSRGCANTQDGKKKKKSEKKSEKQTYQKHQPPQASCVSCVCVALVRVRREARRGGVHRDGIGRVSIRALQWHRCFNFWVQGCTGRYMACQGRGAEHTKSGEKKMKKELPIQARTKM